MTKTKNLKLKEVTRYIKPTTSSILWAVAAGRCQFDSCNRIVYRHPITLEMVNIAERAHIYSFSKNGPRGWGPFVANKKELNEIDNLMLMCHDCHKLIDNDKEGHTYSAELLQTWKSNHEERIENVTGIDQKNKTNVIFYSANIGEQKSPIQKDETYPVLFPEHYPVEPNPLRLSMTGSHEDNAENFWEIEQTHLNKTFQQIIVPRIEGAESAHFTLFSMAPMPLLVQLGALFTDKVTVNTRQPIREPKTWQWQDEQPEDFGFEITQSDTNFGNPVLVMSLSDKIGHERVKNVMGKDIDIWEISTTSAFQNNDFIRSPNQLSLFRKQMRELIADIKKKSGNQAPLHVFPAIPISCAIEMGRIRMPKADMPWKLYDQNNKHRQFTYALTIEEK